MAANILYTFMVVVLGSALTYAVYRGVNERPYDTSGFDASMWPQWFDPDDRSDAAVSAGTAGAGLDAVPADRPLTRKEVLRRMGPPRHITATNDTWTYDDQVVMFRGDQVIGWVKPDELPTTETSPRAATTAHSAAPIARAGSRSSGSAYIVHKGSYGTGSAGPRIYRPSQPRQLSSYYRSRHGYDDRYDSNRFDYFRRTRRTHGTRLYYQRPGWLNAMFDRDERRGRPR